MSATLPPRAGIGLAALVLLTALLTPTTVEAFVIFAEDTLIDHGDMTYEGEDIVVDGATLTVNGAHAFNSLELINGAILTHASNADVQANTLDLDIAAHVTVAAGTAIDVSARGYAPRQGPGAGASNASDGGGGGHGGYGGAGASAAGGASYGSALAPTDLGSGGGEETNVPNGGPGGGAVHLVVSGTLTLDGIIVADGRDGLGSSSHDNGGGAGGSIWLEVSTLAGVGTLRANGGAGTNGTVGGGGGGGRIAVYAANSTFTGSATACPAEGYRNGGGGSALMDLGPGAAQLTLDGCGIAESDSALQATPAIPADLHVRNTARLLHAGDLTITGDLRVADTGTITHPGAEPAGVTLSVDGDIQIAAGGQVDVSGRGYPSEQGPGAGGSTAESGGGAGYGGPGGNASSISGGATYGSLTQPTDLGSGGGWEVGVGTKGGAGGGALKVVATGTLNVNGQILANGRNGTGSTFYDNGGGSGGSVWLDVGTLTGNGTIAANGGNAGGGAAGGGGGGGRVAIYADTDAFAGTVTTCAGTGYQNGGTGTQFYMTDLQTGLVMDNCGVASIDTDLAGATTIDGDVVVRNAARLTLTGTLAITGDLTIEDAGTLTHPAAALGGASISITGDAAIEVGGQMNVTGRGYPPRQGPGAGQSSSHSGGGAGHGGPGGDSPVNSGGATYGSFTEPVTLGSGGGEETDVAHGGNGGGALHVSVGGTFTIDGAVLANGGSGTGSTSQDNGGGAGGSLWLTANALNGSGTIAANGGNGGGGASGGGGGGGRIAIHAGADAFTGTVTACCGSGYENGGTGTIFYDTDVHTALLLDNCGTTAKDTDLAEATHVGGDLRVRNQARLAVTNPLQIDGSIFVDADGHVTHPATQLLGAELTVAGDVTVALGGTISVSQRGYAPRNGPGAGQSTTSSGAGGGYGGRGGNGATTTGGQVYGSTARPADLGSGGGAETDGGGNGGAGGGRLRMSIAGTLTVDGTIRADGGNGSGSTSADHGGGAGGSIWIDVDRVVGTGSITANGGSAGGGSGGGGGGGGRVAVYCCDIQMPSGQFTATGADGYQNGADGTVLFGSNAITIHDQPDDLIAFEGNTATFTVNATTTQGSLYYAWRKDGVPLENDGHFSGVDTPTLVIDTLTLADNGYYDVWLTDDCGSNVSRSARLIVPEPGDLNCDGVVSAADIDPFVIALTGGQAAYEAQFPDCDFFDADINSDGNVSAADIDGFVTLLTGGA
jgi:hypothetical protein